MSVYVTVSFMCLYQMATPKNPNLLLLLLLSPPPPPPPPVITVLGESYPLQKKTQLRFSLLYFIELYYSLFSN